MDNVVYENWNSVNTCATYGVKVIDIYGNNVELHGKGVVSRRMGLKICAPIADMDTTQMRITDGYKMEVVIPDPVVLQPVKGGYFIVTAWGDEASDEIVVNSIQN